MRKFKKAIVWLELITIAYLIGNIPFFIYLMFGIAEPVPDDSHTSTYIMFFRLVIRAPILEELLFRGPIFLAVFIGGKKASRKYKICVILPFVIILSGAVFGLLHLINFNTHELPENVFFYVLDISWNGLTLGFLVWITRNLFPSMILHSIHNLIYILFFWR